MPGEDDEYNPMADKAFQQTLGNLMDATQTGFNKCLVRVQDESLKVLADFAFATVRDVVDFLKVVGDGFSQVADDGTEHYRIAGATPCFEPSLNPLTGKMSQVFALVLRAVPCKEEEVERPWPPGQGKKAKKEKERKVEEAPQGS